MSPQAAVWMQVVEYVAEHPNGVGRSNVAKRFHVGKSTAIEHLEKGVERGLLLKVFTWVTRSNRGWVYYTVDHSAMAVMAGFQDEPAKTAIPVIEREFFVPVMDDNSEDLPF